MHIYVEHLSETSFRKFSQTRIVAEGSIPSFHYGSVCESIDTFTPTPIPSLRTFTAWYYGYLVLMVLLLVSKLVQ